jgi:hypothetical protein
MAKSRFEINNEVVHPQSFDDWRLVLQWGDYVYPDEPRQSGYRFIWRRPDGSQQARPARIPSVRHMTDLIALADKQGWAGKLGN